MKAIYILFIFLIYVLSSCSDLDLKKIECKGDSTKCPSDAICYNDTCRECPSGSEKSGDTCICTKNQNEYFYKEKNTCESTICAPENGEIVSRPLGCQGGLGYCIKNGNNNTGVCKPNTCTSNLDCNHGKQCVFTAVPTILYGEMDELLLLTCQNIGSQKYAEPCNKANNDCERGLSCLDSEDNGPSCQEICIPQKESELTKCTDGRTCIDYASFGTGIPGKIVGACFYEDLLCKFNDDDNKYISVNNESCNNYDGTCYRDEENRNIGFCIADKCDPSEENGCGLDNKCVFNGHSFRCKKINISPSGILDSLCTDSSTCNTELSCVGPEDENMTCQRLCRPNNTYENHSDCPTSQKCVDLHETLKDIGEDTTGVCLPLTGK